MKRLRSSVDVWKNSSGIQIVSQDRTINFNGKNAAPLWDAIEPLLKTGFTPEGLVAYLPKSVQDTVKSLLTELEILKFLVEIEEPIKTAYSFSDEIYRILDGIADRPQAAIQLLAKTTVQLRGNNAYILRMIQESLNEAGIKFFVSQEAPRVHTSAAPSALLISATVQTPGYPDGHLIIQDKDGILQVGPVPAHATDSPLVPAHETASSTYKSELLSAHPVAKALVSAQLIIALVHNAALLTDIEEADTHPLVSKWWITDASLVSEIHEYAEVKNLPDVGSWKILAVKDLPKDDISTIEKLPNELSMMWDSIFGLVDEPHPRDLPQLPVALATCSDVYGRVQGGTSSELPTARWEALEPLLRQIFSLPDNLRLGPNLLLSATSAVVYELLHGAYNWLPSNDEQDWNPSCRRALARLHRLGNPKIKEATLHWGSLSAHQITIVLDGLQSTAVASSKDLAREIAMVRLEGIVQWCATQERASAPAELNVGIVDRDLVLSAIENGITLQYKAIKKLGLVITEVTPGADMIPTA